MNTWGYRIVGFIIGAGVIVALEALIVVAFSSGGYRLIPRGLGWIVLPIIAGVVGAKIAEQRGGNFLSVVTSQNVGSPGWRNIAVGTICWIAAILIWVTMFNGLGSYWSNSDWNFFWKIMLIPPFFVGGAYLLFTKFGAPRQ